MSSNTYADNDSVVDRVKIKVPVSCTLSGTGMNSHNAEIINGGYQANIGTTILHAFCNDASGFAIYAAGYTGDEIGATNSNKLVGTTASNNATIDTGLATSAGNPDVSNWAMKLAISQDSGDTTGTNAFTIDSAPNVANGTPASFSQYHTVPNEYVKVAHKDAATDMTNTTGGVKLTTTYAAYISRTQPADSYSGQVIYTLVHPSTHVAPVANPATLDTGRTVNAKLKSLAATVVNGVDTTITPTFNPHSYEGEDVYDLLHARDEFVKSIIVHLNTAAPAGFIPSEKNTISASTSKKPIYIVFNNANDVGIMHFYTEGDQIILPTDSSYMFYLFDGLTEISGTSDWDSSRVADMGYMFYRAGFSAATFTLNLSSWDTSNVTNMGKMLVYSGSNATTWSVGNLSSWDTSNVTNMNELFASAGCSATSWSVGDLSSWMVSNVTDMSGMFAFAGQSATTWSVGDLSSWDTSNATGMSSMFAGAGYSATSWSVGDLSSWDTSNVTDMNGMFTSAGQSATTWSVGNLSSWKTSKVTDMSSMFAGAGYSATSWSVGDLSSWDTSNVEHMNYMFATAGYSAVSFSLNLSSWNTSKVDNMTGMFSSAGQSATTWSVGNLSSWNTSKVQSMEYMFSYAGYSAATWSVGNLSSWNTSSVMNMNYMFQCAGYSASTFSLDLSSWNTSSVFEMNYMFYQAGFRSSVFSLNLSSWNTSSVMYSMSMMFNGAGSSATTWSVTIPQTNGRNINNTTGRFYGMSSSTYATPPSGKSFTLAQS